MSKFFVIMLKERLLNDGAQVCLLSRPLETWGDACVMALSISRALEGIGQGFGHIYCLHVGDDYFPSTDHISPSDVGEFERFERFYEHAGPKAKVCFWSREDKRVSININKSVKERS